MLELFLRSSWVMETLAEYAVFFCSQSATANLTSNVSAESFVFNKDGSQTNYNATTTANKRTLSLGASVTGAAMFYGGWFYGPLTPKTSLTMLSSTLTVLKDDATVAASSAKVQGAGGGLDTVALFYSGYVTSSVMSNNVERFSNAGAWLSSVSAIGNLNSDLAGCALNKVALFHGGVNSKNSLKRMNASATLLSTTVVYDTTQGQRQRHAAARAKNAALFFGGIDGDNNPADRLFRLDAAGSSLSITITAGSPRSYLNGTHADVNAVFGVGFATVNSVLTVSVYSESGTLLVNNVHYAAVKTYQTAASA